MILGLLFGKAIKAHLLRRRRRDALVGASSSYGRRRKRRAHRPRRREAARCALGVGLCQCPRSCRGRAGRGRRSSEACCSACRARPHEFAIHLEPTRRRRRLQPVEEGRCYRRQPALGVGRSFSSSPPGLRPLVLRKSDHTFVPFAWYGSVRPGRSRDGVERAGGWRTSRGAVVGGGARERSLVAPREDEVAPPWPPARRVLALGQRPRRWAPARSVVGALARSLGDETASICRRRAAIGRACSVPRRRARIASRAKNGADEAAVVMSILCTGRGEDVDRGREAGRIIESSTRPRSAGRWHFREPHIVDSLQQRDDRAYGTRCRRESTCGAAARDRAVRCPCQKPIRASGASRRRRGRSRAARRRGKETRRSVPARAMAGPRAGAEDEVRMAGMPAGASGAGSGRSFIERCASRAFEQGPDL